MFVKNAARESYYYYFIIIIIIIIMTFNCFFKDNFLDYL